jgi:hypothetical protein
MASEVSKRQQLVMRWGMLSSERESWISQWREVSTYLLPGNGRYFLEDRDRGKKRWNKIYDSTGTKALRTLGAGLMSGATSPARPWFRLTTPDDTLNTYQPVKVWLDQVSQTMHKIFQSSNTYGSLQQIYEELGAFGTGAAIILPDFNNVIHHYPLTTGEYCIATDAQGHVVTLYRRFQMQVSQLVKEFGLASCSTSVQTMYERGTLDTWVTVQHSIEPRSDRDPAKKDAKNMAWGSWYFEVGGSGDQFLRESGFKRFPGVAPRWSVTGGDIYGTGPGVETLGDVKGLQHKQLRKAQGIDYQTDPPLAVPVTLKNQEMDRLPGGVTYVDQGSMSLGVKPLFEVTLELQYLIQDIAADQQRIREGFFADLFLMLSNSTDPRMTATEVAARQEEKMLMLGPVFERLSNELFKPLIEMTFDYMVEANAVPPAPQEMQGTPLQVQFVSVLAQAQQAIGTNSVDRFVGALTSVAQTKPEVLDKFDSDAWADSYSDMLGIDPRLVLANDKVQAIRDARAKAQAAQQQLAAQQQASQTAKNLGQTPTSGPANAAMDMMNQFSGYGTSAQ